MDTAATSDDPRASARLSPSPARWRKLSLDSGLGPLYSSSSLCLAVKHEYQGALGMVAVQFQNKGRAPVGNLHVEVPRAKGC